MEMKPNHFFMLKGQVDFLKLAKKRYDGSCSSFKYYNPKTITSVAMPAQTGLCWQKKTTNAFFDLKTVFPQKAQEGSEEAKVKIEKKIHVKT